MVPTIPDNNRVSKGLSDELNFFVIIVLINYINKYQFKLIIQFMLENYN